MMNRYKSFIHVTPCIGNVNQKVYQSYTLYKISFHIILTVLASDVFHSTFFVLLVLFELLLLLLLRLRLLVMLVVLELCV